MIGGMEWWNDGTMEECKNGIMEGCKNEEKTGRRVG